MSDIPADLKYTKDHEWLRIDGDEATVGITDHAQEQLGDVTFVELPEEGASFEQGEEFGVVESVKAASDLYMPVSGEVTEVNRELENTPEVVNTDPYGEAWMIKIKLSDTAQIEALLSAADYEPLAQ